MAGDGVEAFGLPRRPANAHDGPSYLPGGSDKLFLDLDFLSG